MGVVTRLVSIAREETSWDEEPYECKTCGKPFSERYHQCPDCGSYRVERKEWKIIE